MNSERTTKLRWQERYVALAPAALATVQAVCFSSHESLVGRGEGFSLLAAMGCGQGGSRLSSGFCWNSQLLAGQWKGQSQRWSIDVNKTNSR